MQGPARMVVWFLVVGGLAAGLVYADRIGEKKLETGYGGADEASPSGAAKEKDDIAAGPTVVELSPESQRLIGLATVDAQKRQARQKLHASCQVQLDANQQVFVKTFVSGFVQKRLCEQGDRVAAGAPLFEMHSNDLALAKGAFLSASAQADLADVTLRRDEDLIKDKIVSQTQYDTDRAAALTARTAVVNAREQLLIDGLSRDEIAAVGSEAQEHWVVCAVRSPIAGEVIQLTNAHTMGDMGSSGTDLCQVANLDSVWAIGNAYEKDLAFLHVNDSVELSFVSYPGSIWKGKIAAVADYVNPATRTVDVRAILDNKPPEEGGAMVPKRYPLKAGLFGTMDISCDAFPADWVWIPAAAILPYFFEDGRKSVFVEVEPNHFVERRVRVVQEEGTEVAVTGDLSDGQPVVTEGNILLSHKAEER